MSEVSLIPSSPLRGSQSTESKLASKDAQFAVINHTCVNRAELASGDAGIEVKLELLMVERWNPRWNYLQPKLLNLNTKLKRI